MSKDTDFKGTGLISIIADADTVTGFLLGGVGQRDDKNQVNYLAVDSERTTHDDLVAAFKNFTSRKDVAIVMITQSIAQEIRYLISAYDKTIPTILEIPSKSQPYDEKSDPLMQRVLRLMGLE